MSDVGTTHEDLERFLAEHHLVGAGLRRDGRASPRQGNTAAHWKWDGIYRGLKRSGEIVTVGPNGMTGRRTAICAARRGSSVRRRRTLCSSVNMKLIRWSAVTWLSAQRGLFTITGTKTQSRRSGSTATIMDTTRT